MGGVEEPPAPFYVAFAHPHPTPPLPPHPHAPLRRWTLKRDLAAWYRDLGRHSPPGLPEKRGPGGQLLDLYDRLLAHFPAVAAAGIAKADFATFDPVATPLYVRGGGE